MRDLTLIALVAAGLILIQSSPPPQDQSSRTCEYLRNRIEEAGIPPKIYIGKEPIFSSSVLPLFYERRAYQPAWCQGQVLNKMADALIESIKNADLEGLYPNDYHLLRLESLVEEARRYQKYPDVLPGLLSDLDLLLTDAFLIYAAHLVSGKVDPVSFDPEWIARRREVDVAQILEDALSTGRIKESLEDLLPKRAEYFRLRRALARYREIVSQGGWEPIPEGPKMELGTRDARISTLRKRLLASAEPSQGQEDSDAVFDENLKEAVRKFQDLNGLDTDGVVGSSTLAALNVPAEERQRQIELNMERWRWLPQDLGQRYILVNIASFELEVIEDSKTVMNMRIVVGKQYQRTPVFSERMTYLVFNPYWNIPESIAVKEILVSVKKDTGYLSKENIKVLKGWGAEAEEIDPTTIDWASVSRKNMDFRFRQEPGAKNSLGRIKFMFPNRFGVYLHDTPAQALFARTVRAFSHGCIRVEKPVELALYVLKNGIEWTREKITEVISRNSELTEKLPAAIDVHILYWTAWAEENGAIHFRNDIYGRDKLLSKALEEKSPTKPKEIEDGK
ncbi:MAG: L,D-transpeptidase family protein [Candidatus Aminicenantes bacterium]|nr:L,D-transpeptidase family protein [Candidatus Aminicenantes bacterium]